MGQVVDDTAMVLFQYWEEKLAVGFQCRSAPSLVQSDGPVWDWDRVSAEVKIRLNLPKKCEVSGEVFCCLIL